VLPLFALSPHTPVFLGILKRIVARSQITPELAPVVLSAIAGVAHPDAVQIRELLPAAAQRADAARLNATLDRIEGDCGADNPVQTVACLVGQLRRSPFPAGRPFEPICRFCLRTWCDLDESSRDFRTNETNVLYVLRKLHEIPGQADAVYRLYLTLAREQTFAPAKLEQAYQYLQLQFQGALPGGELMQLSLASAASDIDGRGELAIEALTSLTTAYDGVQMMWELVCDQPHFNLEARFTRLPMTARCFLVEGFTDMAAADMGEGRAEREALLRRLVELNCKLADRTREKRDDVQNLNEKLTLVRARMGQSRTPERPKKEQPRQARIPQSTRPPGKVGVVLNR
jgi:hypothetical protein